MKNHSSLLSRGLHRAFLVGLGIGFMAPSARATDIVGQVTDPFGSGALAGATVTVAETGASVATDAAGRFRIPDLAEGTYTLTARYIGYDPRNETVRVPASGEESVTISLGSEVVQLEGMVVEGFRAGRSRALQQKQNQTNISDILSADALGNLPDRNVAEGLARLPGVSLSLDQGEGRYVSIRGAEPGLNQVLLDGATMAAPGGRRLGRAVPLDTLGTGQISQVEVIKSVTPDLDANAVGGTINIKSVSAFDRDGRFFSGTLAGNLNETTSDANPELQVAYTDRFGDKGNIGLAASASYEKRNYENDWVESSWSQVDYNGTAVYVPREFQVKPETGNVERAGVNLNFEYHIDDDTEFFFRPSYSINNRYEDRYESIYSTNVSAPNLTLTSPTTGVFTSGSRTERREFRIEEDQTLFNVASGLKKVLGDFTIEPMLTYSYAKEDRVFFDVFQFRNRTGDTGPITFDTSSFVPKQWNVDLSTDDPGEYQLRRVRFDDGPLDEKTFTAKTDVTWDFSDTWKRPGKLKAGVKYIHRDRVVDLTSYRLVSAGTWDLSQIGVHPSQTIFDGRFNSGFLIDWDATDAFVAANPDLTTYDEAGSASNSIEDDYNIVEKIFAGYAMGTLKVGRFDLLGGVRWERTDATIGSVQVRSGDGEDLGTVPIEGSTTYDKVLPNLQGVYRFTDSVLARAAITKTIGRPAYEDASPLSQFEYDALEAPADPNYPNTGSLEIGNPQLGPYDSLNYDLSLEWYTPAGGVLAAAYFRKEINDPIYSYNETQTNVTYNGVGLEQLHLSSVRNADSASISGVELTAYQPFRFLPAPFDGFGIDANLTFVDSSVKIPLRPDDDLPFFQQPSQIANVTLFYQKSGFSVRLAWNRSSEQLVSVGSAPLGDEYRRARQQYDAQAGYRFNEHYSITASVRNLTEEPEEFSYGIKSLLQSSRQLGRDYRLAVNFNF